MYSSAELAECRATLKGGSRSFHVAAGLLPRRVREPAAVLYAFCREADDLVDDGGGLAAISCLHARLARLGTHSPATPHDALLSVVMRRHGIPSSVLAGLVDGFAWDVEGRRYRTIDDLLDYAMRVAGTVGLAMALVMGARGRRALHAASALGMAMQLTNICRDVAEDARLGRLYLPLEWLEAAGIDPDAWLQRPAHSPELAGVVARLLELADGFYAMGDVGLAALPEDCRGGIRAARRLYAEIGHTLRRGGCDPLAGRTVVGPWRKLGVLLGRHAAPAAIDPLCEAACERAAACFVETLPPQLLTASSSHSFRPGSLPWVLDLFERLERRAIDARAREGEARA